jgi:hypothetical protein
LWQFNPATDGQALYLDPPTSALSAGFRPMVNGIAWHPKTKLDASENE